MAVHAEALWAFPADPSEKATAPLPPLMDAEIAAFSAVVAYPCTSFQMAPSKARHLLESWPVNGDDFPVSTQALLRSLLAWEA